MVSDKITLSGFANSFTTWVVQGFSAEASLLRWEAKAIQALSFLRNDDSFFQNDNLIKEK